MFSECPSIKWSLLSINPCDDNYDTQMSVEIPCAFRFKRNREINLLKHSGIPEGGGITYIIFWFSVAVSSELIQFVDHLVDGVSIQAHVRIDLACSSHKSSNSNCNNIAINLHKSSPCPENWQNFLCIAGNGVLEYKNFIDHVWQTGIQLSSILMRILQFSIPTFCHVSL